MDNVPYVVFFPCRTIFANLRSNRENKNREMNGRVQRCGHLLARARRGRAACSFL